jgi:hypothetical protein
MKRLAALATLLALGLIGCGGAKTTSLSEQQLQKRATALCATAARRAGRIPTPSNEDQGADYLNRGIAALKPELAGLRTLKAPDDVADVYAAIMTAFSKQLDELKKTVRKLHSGEDPVVAWKTLQTKIAPLEATEDSAWRTLDIPACVSS